MYEPGSGRAFRAATTSKSGPRSSGVGRGGSRRLAARAPLRPGSPRPARSSSPHPCGRRAPRARRRRGRRRGRSRPRPGRRAGRSPRSPPSSRARRRERLQKCEKRVSTVSASASSFAQASVRTSPVRSSRTTTGTRPRVVEGEPLEARRDGRADRHPGLGEGPLDLPDGEGPVVEDGRREDGVRAPVEDRRGEVRERSRAPRGDDRDGRGRARRLQHREVETRERAVGVHRGEEDLPRAARGHLGDPGRRARSR